MHMEKVTAIDKLCITSVISKYTEYFNSPEFVCYAIVLSVC